MGRAKALLPIGGGDTFLTRIVRTFAAAGVTEVIVVLGHEADAIARALDALDAGLKSHATGGLKSCDPVAQDFSPAIRIAINRDYDRGQLSSLQAGLALADRPEVPAVLMTVVDVPLFDASTVRAVLDRYETTHAPVVRPVSGDRHGHPILIDRSLFEALRRASDADGAKPIVRAHASAAGDVTVTDEGAFCDIDTADEYDRIIRARAVGDLPPCGPAAR